MRTVVYVFAAALCLGCGVAASKHGLWWGAALSFPAGLLLGDASWKWPRR